jgi:hypothetical protein
MTGALASIPPTAPLPGATSAMPGPSAGGDDPRLVAVLQEALAIVQQIIAIASAQAGAANVIGGGASATASGAVLGATTGASTGMSGFALVGGYDAGLSIPSSGSILPGPEMLIGGPTNALSSPAIVDTAPTTGGGAAAAPSAPAIDMQRITGTPQPGGVIDIALRAASTVAAEARSEGAWMVLDDGNGARLQAHVHGPWSSHPTRIAEGIQRGFIAVHLHPDGTLHLHDVA